MPFEVSSAAIAEMLAQARQAHPCECCGLLLGGDEAIAAILPARNVHPEPHRHFEIDPQALIDAHRTARAGGPRVVGCYHSHPDGSAAPSATDRAMAARDGAIWAVIAAGRVTLWRSGDAGFEPLPYADARR